jgi:hypothetical protein
VLPAGAPRWGYPLEAGVGGGPADGFGVVGGPFGDTRRRRVPARSSGHNRHGSKLAKVLQDWAATKAAYRIFANPRVDESVILAGHFTATQSRIAAAHVPILIVHGTTEFSFQRQRPETIGKTRVVLHCRIEAKRITECGLDHEIADRVAPLAKPRSNSCWSWPASKFSDDCDLAQLVHDAATASPGSVSLTWMIFFPKFSPRSNPMSSRGAFSSPAVISSLVLIWPARTH